MSRADLARHLGLTKVTVSDLVAELLARGHAVELGPSGVVRPGKPATLVDVNRTGLQTVGLDLAAPGRAPRRRPRPRRDGPRPRRADPRCRTWRLRPRPRPRPRHRDRRRGDRPGPRPRRRDARHRAPGWGRRHRAQPRLDRRPARGPARRGDGAAGARLQRRRRRRPRRPHPRRRRRRPRARQDRQRRRVRDRRRWPTGRVARTPAPARSATSPSAPTVAPGAAAAGTAASRPGSRCRTSRPRSRRALRTRRSSSDPLREAGERLGIALAPVVGVLDLAEVVLSGPEHLLAGPLLQSVEDTLRSRMLTRPDRRPRRAPRRRPGRHRPAWRVRARPLGPARDRLNP